MSRQERAAKKWEPVFCEKRAKSRKSGAFGDSIESPKALVAIGVGCRAGVAAEAIAALVRRALKEAGAPEGERRMFTLAAKAHEPGLVEAARVLGAELMALPLAALKAQAERILTPSPAAQSRFGAPNIAEAAALAGAGDGGRLLGPRLAADGATCAVALSPERPRGGAPCAVALPPEQR